MISKCSRTTILLVALALAVAVTGVVQGVPADTSQLAAPCVPTTIRAGKTTQVIPPAQDLQYGECLFDSTVDFAQANPQSLFASCNGCHIGNQRDRGTHPVIVTNALGTFIPNRQAPNLLNVQFNVPLGWDGRHGGALGNQASIIAAIVSAATGAINSQVEMVGHIDPTKAADQAKLAALAAFVISRSPTAPNPKAAPVPPPVLDPETLASIQMGANVFFGRSSSTSGLLHQGKACVSCHVLPFFTDNKIRTNVLNPNAAFDFGFRHADGSMGAQDPGAGLVTVTDATSGKSVQVGTFKTPSLHHFYPDGEPAFHSGIFGEDDKLFQFYEKSLGFTLGAGESTGLRDWLVHCPKGPERSRASLPTECN